MVAGVLVAMAVFTGCGDTSDAGDSADEAATAPPGLSALGRRVLAEVEGAAELPNQQVLIPRPVGELPLTFEQLHPAVPPGELLHIEPIAGLRETAGVTDFAPTAFPEWLYGPIDERERGEAVENESLPRGTRAEGVVVDLGASSLACWRPSDQADRDCLPVLTAEVDGHWRVFSGIGFDEDFSSFTEREITAPGESGAVHLVQIRRNDVSRVVFRFADSSTTVGTLFPRWGAELAVAYAVVHADLELESVDFYDELGQIIDVKAARRAWEARH